MDLKVDYAFKQLFGSEKNKDITVVFLNAILDLLVVTNADEWINVEIQFTNKYDMVKRSIYYWSGAYRQPMKKGKTYKELRPVIAINILNFNLFQQTEQFHTTYHLYEDKQKFKLTNVMEFHFIEMVKLIKYWKEDKLDPWNNVLARWLLMLGMVDHRNNQVYRDIFRELEEISMKDKSLKNAFQNWEELSMTQEEYLAYESRLKRVLDEEAAQREAELRIQEAEQRIQQADKRVQQAEERAQQVEQRAEKEAREEIAKSLLQNGMDIELVAKNTKLTKERVLEIWRNI
ncbi:Rpn family recombination-promoting nuclease/putative transposase [Aquibacillus sediminis]|uniref:Rpn family recombination-promoting nuclease/putative transposase n=1 Tax=Aquibacillus sediminis TaxID=2574734 RepID=UPI0011085A70|nr:Rpn family recombination-promoting nuclease/putative transposase [Aquibacillus sediminis]